MTIPGRLVLKLLCSFTVATRAVRQGEEKEGANPTPEGIEPKPEDVAQGDPIPGSQTWLLGRLHNFGKSVHRCGQNQFCCMRGCRYLVEQDKCGECQGHNVKQLTPAQEIKQYQTTMRKFRIPSGVVSKWNVVGCLWKGSVPCVDKDQKKACCCNSGFIFDFNTRQCVPDGEDPSNKEEPIPGTEWWGIIYGHTYKMTFGINAKKCAWHPKKWCCNRGCQYTLQNDKCGQCAFDEGTTTPPKEVIKKFIAENGNYVIPRSIAKPGPSGVCWVKHSKKCVAQGSNEGLCCCHAGFYFSFLSRKCVEPAQQQKEIEEDEAEDQAAEAAAARAAEAAEFGPSQAPTQAPSIANDDDLKRAMSRSVHSGKDRNGAGHTGLSLALLVFMFALWR